VLAWLVAAVLATMAAVRLIGGGEGAAAPPVRVDGAGGPGSPSGPPAGGSEDGRAAGARGEGEPRGATGAGIYVHVAGAIRRPGLLRLAPGSRAAAAIERAGGFTRRADVTAVNLAAPLQDGQQVVVPLRGRGGTGAVSAGGAAAAASGAKPSLATATLEQLDAIDGIGPTLAERIIEQRTEAGGFGSIGELRDVEGIGEKRFATLRDALQP
jgi:competence protein ComEA